jgi:hypothetical protein
MTKKPSAKEIIEAVKKGIILDWEDQHPPYDSDKQEGKDEETSK